MFTGWLWRTIKPRPLAVVAIVAIWGAVFVLLWFLLYPTIGPLDLISPSEGPGIEE